MSQAPLTNPSGYNLSYNPVPDEFMSVLCNRVFVEFLGTDPTYLTEKQKERKALVAHSTLKFDFASPHQGRYLGARLALDIDWSGAINGTSSYDGKPGYLHVKPLTYAGITRSSGRTYELEMPSGPVRLDTLIDTIMEAKLHDFDFVCDELDDYYGCRDFITQAIYLLSTTFFLSPKIIRTFGQGGEGPIDSIYTAMGMRFGATRFEAAPIDKGKLLSYERVVLPEMPYEGTSAAQRLLDIHGSRRAR